ncbi:MAG TPA: endolytic transglycosylase MltG [Candidatus Paceibacterota bacterium]
MDDGSLRYISEPPEPILLDAPQKPPRKPFCINFRFSFRKWPLFCALFAVALVIGYQVLFGAPLSFPTDTVLTIAPGQTLSGVAHDLEANGTVRSAFAFKAVMIAMGGSKTLKAGDYYLDERQSAVALASRIKNSEYELVDIRITIPEGWSSGEIAAFIDKDKRFAHFDAKEFIKIAEQYEGYLFPDTYMFLPTVTAEDVLNSMLDNYKKRIETLASEIKTFGRPIKDVIIMASIIEEEARTEESRRLIAGILWKRLDEKMLLQVDAAFAFVNGKKASSELTLADLKIDSPYNTYVYKGLPPGPISNPGLAAISATVRPIKTAYYFYLTDNDGNMRYGVTHDEHVANKNKYLR